MRPCGLNSPINLLLFEHLGLVGAAILLEAGDHLAHALDKRSEHVDDLGPKRRHDLRHHGDVELARSIEIEVALVLICRLRTILRQCCIDRERRHDRRRLVERRGLTLVLGRLADRIQVTVGLGGLYLVLGRLFVDGQRMHGGKRVDKRPLTLVGKRARRRVLVLGVTSGLDIDGLVALSRLRINKRLNKRRLLNGSGHNLGNALSDLLDLGHNRLRRENLATRRVKRSINGNRGLNLSAHLGHVDTHGRGRGGGRRLRHGHNRRRNRLNSLDNGSGALCHLSRHRAGLVLDLAIGGKHTERLHNIQTVANRAGIVAQRLLLGLLSGFCLVAHRRDDIKTGKGIVCGSRLYLLGGSGAEHRISGGDVLLRVRRIIERIRLRRGDLGRVIVCLAARDAIANPACSATGLLGTVLDRTEQRGNRIRRVRKHRCRRRRLALQLGGGPLLAVRRLSRLSLSRLDRLVLARRLIKAGSIGICFDVIVLICIAVCSSRSEGLLLGAPLLLGHIGIEVKILRELLALGIGRHGIHHTEHGGHGRLVADGTRSRGHEETAGDVRNRNRKRNKRHKDGDDPEQNGERAGQRQQAHDGDGTRCHGADRRQLEDQVAVLSDRLLGKQVGMRGVVMRDDDHRAVAGRGERARGLVVGDDVLRIAPGAELGEGAVAKAVEHIQNGRGQREQKPEHTDHAAHAHQHRADERHDAHGSKAEALARRGLEILHDGVKAMIGEDVGQLIGASPLLLAACRRRGAVLKEVIDIFLGVRHMLHIH